MAEVDGTIFVYFDQAPAKEEWHRFQGAMLGMLSLSHVDRNQEARALTKSLRAYLPATTYADLGPAEERLRLYLVEHWGGPAEYTRLRGPARLAARHMPFRIARAHRDAWLRAMRIAVDEAGVAPAHRDRLWGHLETVAAQHPVGSTDHGRALDCALRDRWLG